LPGYLDLAQCLVSQRADVNALDHQEGTVLHYAAVVDHSPKLVRFYNGQGTQAKVPLTAFPKTKHSKKKE